MRTTINLLSLTVGLFACGPGSGEPTSTSTGDPDTTAPGTSGGPTGGPATGEPTSGTTGAPSTTVGPTSDPATGTGSETSVGETGSETSVGETSGSESGTGDTTTGGGAVECVEDADCKLHDDCCSCDGVPADEDVVVCDEECVQSRCSELGIKTALCRLGVCQTERLQCDGSQVLCDAEPPLCPPGTAPEVSPVCWTGDCVPVEYCDAVSNCLECPADRMCVEKVGRGDFGWPACEPVPAVCGGQVDCDCAGGLVCEGPFSQCFAQGGNALTCECPNC
jgi:hypothetical protein